MPTTNYQPHYTWQSTAAREHLGAFANPWDCQGDFPRHDHSFFEVFVCLKGEGIHCSILGNQPFVAGDVILLRPGAWHGYRDCNQVQSWVCCFSQDVLLNELAWTMTDSALGWLLWNGPAVGAGRGILMTHVAAPHLEHLSEYLARLSESADIRDTPVRGIVIGWLTLILSEIARSTPDSPGSAYARTAHQAVLEAIRQMENNLGESWTAQMLAEQLQIDASYLTRRFRQATGLPPMAFLARSRAERAAVLLQQKASLSVTEIGALVGWPDPSHFARRFRAILGLSPTQYREMIRNKR